MRTSVQRLAIGAGLTALIAGVGAPLVHAADKSSDPTWVCNPAGDAANAVGHGMTFAGGTSSTDASDFVACSFTAPTAGTVNYAIQTGNPFDILVNGSKILDQGTATDLTGNAVGVERFFQGTFATATAGAVVTLTVYPAAGGGQSGMQATGTIGANN